MAEQTASFKVTLNFESSPNKSEVRRFVLPNSSLTSFSNIKDKLKAVFHTLQSVPFTVIWEDNDGDQILISSDEELRIALNEMKGDIYRLKIEVPGTESTDDSTKDNVVHPGVCCDGCNKDVLGYRYKCIQCPNYDLCSSCEMNGIHQEHFMVRIPKPILWRPDFGRRLVHHMTKGARKFKHCPASGEEKCRSGTYHHRTCHSSDWGNQDGESGNARRESLPHFLHYLFRSMWDPSTEAPGSAASKREDGQGGAGGEAANETASASANTSNEQQEADGHATYLKTIGETVASLLDPLGIDVNIEVETKDGKVKCTGSESGVQSKTSKDERANGDRAYKCEDERSEASAVSKGGEEEKSDVGDWMLVNKEDNPPKVSKPETEKSSESASSTTESHESGSKTTSDKVVGPGGTGLPTASVYPDLPYNQPHVESNVPPLISCNAPAPPMMYPVLGNHIPTPIPPPIHFYPPSHPLHLNNPLHNFMSHPIPPQPIPSQPIPTQPIPNAPHRQLRPNIEASLQKMMSMGFTNEGGWLIQLLEGVNGDIHKALDILQPIRK